MVETSKEEQEVKKAGEPNELPRSPKTSVTPDKSDTKGRRGSIEDLPFMGAALERMNALIK